MNDERYWNINLLNKWFAISSIIFMASMIWMFIDDNDDDFKTYQRAFRRMEIKNSEVKLLKELEEVKNERAGYEEKLSIAQKSFDEKQDELTQSLSYLEQIKADKRRKRISYAGC